MTNILTDDPTTYQADDVFAGTKTNDTARAATDSDIYVTAQWGIKHDTDLQALNSWLYGDVTAGTAGQVTKLAGEFQTAENVAFAGAVSADVSGNGGAIGPKTGSNGFQIQAGAAGKSTVYFTSPTQLAAGAVDYDHATGILALRAGNSDEFQVSGASINALTKRVINVVDPTDPQDAATMAYVDAEVLGATPSHGALEDLGVPADHTWAALVDGTRDITGTQKFLGDVWLDHAMSPTLRLDKNGALDTATFTLEQGGSPYFHIELAASGDAFQVGRYSGGGGLSDIPISIDNVSGHTSFVNSILMGGAAIGDAVSGAADFVMGDGSSAEGLTLFTSSAGIGSVQFTDTAATKKGAIEYQQSAFTMSFACNGSNELALSPVALYPSTDHGLNLGATNLWFGTTYTTTLLVADAEIGDAVAGSANVVVGDGSVAAGITLFSSATTSGSIEFTDTAATVVGSYRYDHNQTRHEWGTEGGDELTLTTSALAPAVTGGLALGSLSLRWGDALMDRGFFGGATGSNPVSGADELVLGDGVGSRGITIFTATNGTGTLEFIDTSATANGWVRYDHDNTRMDLGIEGSSELYLTGTALTPAADKGQHLGSASLQFDDVFAVALRLEEQASPPATAAPGEGIFSVDNSEPTTPQFTNDDDVTHRLAYANAWSIVIKPDEWTLPSGGGSDPAQLGARNEHPILTFDYTGGTGFAEADYAGIWPRGYAGNGIKIRIHYVSTSTGTGDVVWQVQMERLTAQDIDSDGFATVVKYTHTGGPSGTSGLPVVAEMTLTDGAQLDSIAAGELFRMKLLRDDSEAADTFLADADILMVEILEDI